ncbi:DUF1684 domain-containing protein [Salegentibacter maritimus]|uniref:DUF1684 domain-containing protein n=1 Tax=Salegentibacter maritimus TaxID=2794347 RepID=A0ABS0THF1_9FLAO|nr:DUF1684 domain-containing protein [Salegentibacter maritimus]
MFLPFTNLTNTETTYSGGRHLDLRIPEGDFIYLNSNKAFRLYCSYSAYSKLLGNSYKGRCVKV